MCSRGARSSTVCPHGATQVLSRRMFLRSQCHTGTFRAPGHLICGAPSRWHMGTLRAASQLVKPWVAMHLLCYQRVTAHTCQQPPVVGYIALALSTMIMCGVPSTHHEGALGAPGHLHFALRAWYRSSGWGRERDSQRASSNPRTQWRASSGRLSPESNGQGREPDD